MALPYPPDLVGFVVVVVTVAGALAGLAGFGFALVGTMALASVIDPATAVAFVIVLALVTDLLTSQRGAVAAGSVRTCSRR